MNTNPEDPSNESDSNIQSGITRRTFIKRTAATTVITSLALHSFRHEVYANIPQGPGGGNFKLSETHDFGLDQDCESWEELTTVRDAWLSKGDVTPNYGYLPSGWIAYSDPYPRKPAPFTPVVTITELPGGRYHLKIEGSYDVKFYGPAPQPNL